MHHDSSIFSSPTNSAATTSTPTNGNNNNNNSNSSTRDPTIRHSGRAHIRGQFRRIWRPRYLELLDNGMIRYYELPSTADVTLPEDSDLDHVNMIPKDTLLIYHARIIDVTTLRDLHVGLPGGSFGFLFRGQRSLTQELMVKSTEPNPPRDFFCAVSTLDEAQTWVVALQWAATMCQRIRRSLSSGSDNNTNNNNCAATEPGRKKHRGQQQQRQMLPASASLSPAVKVSRKIVMSPDNNNNSKSGSSIDEDITIIEHVGESVLEEDDNDVVTIPSTTTTITRPMNNQRINNNKGRIIVTKVLWYRITKSKKHSLQWEVSYEIALLLLQPPRVEERRVLKTKHELIQMFQHLIIMQEQQQQQEEENKNPEALEVLKSLQGSILVQLPEFAKGCKPQEVTESIPKVDKLLRTCSMNSFIVNTKAFKSAFLLDVPSNDPVLLRVCEEPSWWKAAASSQITFRKVRSIRSDANTDEFVKQWLLHTAKQQHKHHQPQTNLRALWLLQKPWMVLGGTGIGLASLVPFWQVYQQHVPSVRLRVDLLALSWMAAAYMGKEYFGNGGGKTPSSSLDQRRTTTKASLKSSSSVKLGGTTRTEPNRGGGGVPTTTKSSTDTLQVVVGDDDEEVDEEDEPSTDGEDILDEMMMMMDANGMMDHQNDTLMSSPLPQYPANGGETCWSIPTDNSIFRVRGPNYFSDKIKIPSGPAPFQCRGVDLWLADNPLRHIARHPSVMGGKLGEEDTFLVNFLLPFGNFVSYFTVPPLDQFPGTLASVWSKFVKGDQQYRDARLKLLPIVMEGPWIVKAAVGNGTAPALLGKVIPLQYYFQEGNAETKQKGVYEVDVIITASSIAKGILSVVKGHTKSLSIAFAFIIEAAEQEELPETALCYFQIHKLHLEHCPHLPEFDDLDY